jgi:hypothetical protein
VRSGVSYVLPFDDRAEDRLTEQAVNLGLDARPLSLVRFAAVAPAAPKQAFLPHFLTAGQIACATGRSFAEIFVGYRPVVLTIIRGSAR